MMPKGFGLANARCAGRAFPGSPGSAAAPSGSLSLERLGLTEFELEESVAGMLFQV
jgi:hypothetical protein